MVLVAMLAMWQSALAYDFSVVVSSGQRLYFNIIGENAVEVIDPTYPTKPTGDLVIPSSVTHGGTSYAVTSIGGYAFYQCDGLTSVNIPNSVTSIGDYAFRYCYGLTSVTIPNTVTSIGNDAFYYCDGLTSVTIGNSVTSIGGYAFAYCSGLTSVTIPASLTTMQYAAFHECSGLTSVYYTGTIAQWCGISFGGEEANPLYHAHTLYYNGGTLLTDLVIPEELTEIKQYAFVGCTSITSIVCQSATPPSLGQNAFASTDIPVTVPCGSIADYQNAPYWELFTNYQDDCGTPATTYYTVSVYSNNNVWGMTYGGGSIAEGQATTLNAVPTSGFQFVRWDDGNTDNPRTVTVTSDANFVGYFEPIGAIRDTVYVIAPERGTPRITVYAEGDAIVAEGADGNTVTLYDANGNDLTTECAITGTPVRFESLASGTYYVKIGILPSRLRVVVR